MMTTGHAARFDETAAPAPAASAYGQLSIFARTDRGGRPRNQDAFLAADLTVGRTGLGPEMTTHAIGVRGSLLAVSDGAGEVGDEASELAVTALHRILSVMPDDVLPDEQLRRATHHAAKYLYTHFKRRAQIGRGSATLTAVLIRDGAAYVAQIGDSRAYLLRDGEMRQITRDQTLMQALVDSGTLTATAARPPDMMLQSLGSDPSVRAVVTRVDVRAGDVFLLCTDGVSDTVDPAAMRATVASLDLADACQAIAELAVSDETGDNATVLLARVDSAAYVDDDDVITWTMADSTTSELH